MQEQQQRPPPPAYLHHDPESLQLPSVPTHAPTRHGNGRLPGIRALDLPDAAARHTPRSSMELSPRSHTLPALHGATLARLPDGHAADVGSPMDTASVLSAHDDAAMRRDTSVSMDDPDVRLAAEALSGLGNPDFAAPTARSLTSSTDFAAPTARSLTSYTDLAPPTSYTDLASPTARPLTVSAREPTAEPHQPMLSLLTSNHPWLGGTISGSLAAYNLTKDYSPRFVKYGAELVERNVGSPMVNTVSSVGRRTGMEKNLRRYLGEQHRRPSDLEQGDADAPRKRQRAGSPPADAMEIDSRTSSRARGGSQSSYAESLPAYDDQRSPSYQENAMTDSSTPTMTDSSATTAKEPERRQQSSAVQDRRVAWSTQLIMTTSGLGVALSAASLRSLKQCLHLLRGATSHIDSVMRALKLLLAEYETALRQRRASGSHDQTEVKVEGDDKEDEVRNMAEKIKTLSSDIWQTLQGVVQSVSRYTGGALPQNASQVVRTQLLSVPQRWQLAGRRTANAPADEEAGEAEAVRGANRMLAFAMEGLDMMGQITTVVDGTVQSAESWLARIGRAPPRPHGESTAEKRPVDAQHAPNGYPADEKRY